jgi:selenocysteine-specific elongation factor
MKYVIVGTAGHIDHGKSALVQALTGTDPDRWEEEKRRGITIDLGFAHLDLGDEVRVGFIDVPGHERFVRNMLAGVGGIDLVLLVIAADESVKPQTREHFDICRLLGIRKGLVALTKADLVEPDLLGLVRLEVQDFVAGSFLENAPIVPVSAKTGAGLEELKTELRRLSLEIEPRPAQQTFRLPIDRAFVMKGFGAVVTGTLIAGKVEREAEVEIFPLGRRARVRGVEVHNQPASAAIAGQRTALNLAGVDAKELARGMTLAPPGLFEATARLDVSLSLLPGARPLKNRARVHFHCWTAETVAEVVLLDAKELAPGGLAYAQLRLQDPGLFLPGDRFIIRQLSPVLTIGGGVVLDSQPSRHRTGDERVPRLLETLERGTNEERLEQLIAESGEIAISRLVARTGWPPAEALRVAAALEKAGRAVLLGQPPVAVVHSSRVGALSRAAIEQLEQFHAANPLVGGISREELRGRVTSREFAPSQSLFNALLASLAAENRIEMEGEAVRLAGRRVQLSPEEARARDEISNAFEQAGLAVPSAREVLAKLAVDRGRAEKILQNLLKEKVLVRVAEDLVFHRSALDRLRSLIAEHKGRSNRLNVAVFKEMTGLTRKYAIPLLEYLDRERVTRRAGDERVIL